VFEASGVWKGELELETETSAKKKHRKWRVPSEPPKYEGKHAECFARKLFVCTIKRNGGGKERDRVAWWLKEDKKNESIENEGIGRTSEGRKEEYYANRQIDR